MSTVDPSKSCIPILIVMDGFNCIRRECMESLTRNRSVLLS